MSVVDVVIAGNVEAEIEAEVVDSLDISEPFLITDDVCTLYAWEDTPYSAEGFESVSVLAEA